MGRLGELPLLPRAVKAPTVAPRPAIMIPVRPTRAPYTIMRMDTTLTWETIAALAGECNQGVPEGHSSDVGCSVNYATEFITPRETCYRLSRRSSSSGRSQ